jgi:diguanylate cyclase (GGDEF)-like protein
MTGHYDSGLVIFSILIAFSASFVTIDLASRLTAARGSGTAIYWLLGGATSMGIGIWAMHFVGMLAFTLPIPMSYDLSFTLGSLLVAILASGSALDTLRLDSLQLRRLLIAGTMMGAGIASMHYLGMEAMRMRPRIVYDPGIVTLSVVIAIAASIGALWIAFQLRFENMYSGLGKKCAGALVMGLAISGMHYTGMKAASFPMGSICTANTDAIDHVTLAGIVAALALTFLMSSLVMSVFVVLPRTIRGRIVLLIAGCMVPVTLMAMAIVGHDYYRGKDFLVGSSIFAARAAMGNIDKMLENVETGLLTLAESHNLAQDNMPLFNRRMTQAAIGMNVDAITLSDSVGHILLDTRQPTLSMPTPSDNPILAQRIFDIGKPEISDLFIPEKNGRPQITVQVPVRQNGAIIYFLKAVLYANRIQNLLMQQKIPIDRVVAIFDRSGTFVARNRETSRFVGTKGSSAVLEYLRGTADEGSFENLTVEGISVSSTLSRSASSHWTVGIGIPTDILLRDLWNTIRWMMVLLVLLLLFSLTVAWRIGNSITRSIRSLIAPALALGIGEHIKMPLLGLFEADEVGTALNQASVLLQQSQHDAQHDVLTGIANRALFNAILQQQLMLSKRGSEHLAVLYIDLDGFKKVNDSHGHETGDVLLKAVSARIQSTIRDCDLAARLGGDEFAVLMTQTAKHGPASVAGKLIENLSVPYPIGGVQLEISASVGIAIFPEAGDTAQGLLRAADEAMYRAKQRGKKNYVISS